MLKRFNRLLALAAALIAGVGLNADQPAAQEPQRRTAAPTTGGDQSAIVERATRRRTLAMARQAAAERAKPAREAAKATMAAAKVSAKGATASAAVVVAKGVAAPVGVLNPQGTPDYMGGVVPNYANSPALHKFVDTLPGVGYDNRNNLGNYIPMAVADTQTFPGSDFYDLAVVDYTQQLHSDLGPTHLRGYADLKGDGKAHYLGPIILARRDRPVRVKFTNLLTGGLKLPVDSSLMGSGTGPGGSTFSQNRAELHLHGGMSPWISDGTPHQWVTPAGDASANKKGVSFRNVPDMIGQAGINDSASDGIGSYFWTNQQSGRFMFYHDHSFGLTRLNVYSGEAAGYIIVDPVEDKLINAGILPNNGGGVYNYGVPLVVQDKTFVPALADLVLQDPTWDPTAWGAPGSGDLWYPHVYMPNQNPGDQSGANAMGRWDYGPWFWPPVPVATDPLAPTPANTIPYDHRPVPDMAAVGNPDRPGTPNPSLTPEAFMDTPVINGVAYPKVTLEPKAYRFRLLNAANDRMFAFSFYYVDPAHPTEVKMIEASPSAAAGGPKDPTTGAVLWPTDGRDGGVVDWATAGPDIIQIGNEGGFLPTPVIWKSQATTYNYNRRDIVVLDIANHGLFLGPAERADVIVDFSSVPSGSKLILYNDMLAPVPAFDVRYDYFTGAPDQTGQGGAPSTPEGFGPNTRTLMQVEIVGTPAAPFDVAALQAAFTSTDSYPSAFQASQHLPIVPQSFYDSAMGAKTPTVDTYSTIQAYELKYTATETGLPVTMPMQPKAIQELFELDYGRMNATLGIELPFTNFNNQTTIPLGYSEPATEVLKDGETQIWKVTHNGVDTHPVHFHLFDVQLVNRVGWDGAVRFPEGNEVGWKETVKMKPLEDAIVAFRPISPRLPFVLGNSFRVIDPTKDTNALISVTDLGAGSPNQGNLGNQITVPNAVTDYGWEYVWHCHILGHEENDFMRPVVLNVATTLPVAADTLTATVNANAANRVDLSWADHSDNETGFSIQRRDHTNGTFAEIATAVPNAISWSDFNITAGQAYDYQVVTYNQAGPAASSNVVSVNTTTPAGPVVISGVIANGATALAGVTVTFSTGETAVTNALGAYSVTLTGPYTGTVTPSLNNYVFTPATRSYAAVSVDQTVQNFAATQQVVVTGTVSFGANALPGVTLTASTGQTATSGADGSYTITLPAPFTGSLTASLAGYLFTPASRAYTSATLNQSAQDFAATALITLSGNAGVGTATVTVTGLAPVTTDASGNFTVTVSAPYTGSISAAKPGYFFAPATLSLSAVSVSTSGYNFTATPAIQVFGLITTNTVPALPLPGVTVTFSNGVGTATTDANGLYTANVPSGWSGTITPALAGYVFAPASRTLTGVTSIRGAQDFVAGVVYVVSGSVKSNGVALAGVTVNFSNGGGSVVTAADGSYTRNLRAGWTGTITPVLRGYQFSPTNLTVAVPLAGPLSQNFVTVQTISGRAQVRVNGQNVGLAGVTITLSTGGPVTTDVNGNFTVTVNSGWTGSISASGGGKTWTPASFPYSNLVTNVTGLRFNGI
jgi:FtsP/CotA-like multicopper oxidase with cupredoxin domain